TGASAVMVGRGAQGNPWALREMLGEDGAEPSREEVVAELVLFVRETVRELGERRASSFLKKFYGWYLGRGRFPRPFKQELVQLATTEDVELRLLAAAPGAAELVERLAAEVPATGDDVLLDMPISVDGGGWARRSRRASSSRPDGGAPRGVLRGRRTPGRAGHGRAQAGGARACRGGGRSLETARGGGASAHAQAGRDEVGERRGRARARDGARRPRATRCARR